jgi:hypothetical protein
MTQTINGLATNTSVLTTDVIPTGKGGINPDLKTTISSLINAVQNNSTNKINIIYVSKQGNDTTGNGTEGNPYLTCLKANSVASFGDAIFVGNGSFAESNFQFKPGINWIGIDKNLVVITMASAALDTTAWNSATSPYLSFLNITLTFTAFDFHPSSLKSNSKYSFYNCIVNNTANLRLVENLEIFNSSFTTLNSYYIANSFSKDSTYSNTLAARAGNSTEVPEVNFYSDGDFLSNVSVLNDADTILFAQFKNAADQINSLTIDCASADNTVVFVDMVSIPTGNGVTIQNPGSVSPIVPREDLRYSNTFYGIGNWANNNSAFYYTGATGSNANTFAMGRSMTAITVPDAVCLGFASADQSGSFIAWDYSNTVTRGKCAKINQFAVKYNNGYGFGTDNPNANVDIRAGATGDMLFSANAAVADANIQAGQLNPYITTTSLILKGKYTGGSVFNYDLSALTGYPLLSSSNTFTNTNTFSSSISVKEITTPLVENLTPNTLTANSGTLSAGQLVAGIIYFTPTADAAWTFPTGSDINTELGNTSANRGRKSVRFVNNTSFSVTFSTNTNMNFNGLTTPGTFILPAYGSINFDLVKIDTTPTYSIFGSSYGSVSYVEQNYIHVTNWTGVWASDQAGNCNITRIGDQVFMTIPQVSALSTISSVITNVTAIPARFRPTADIRLGPPTVIDSSQTNNRGNGATKLSSAGILTVYRTGNDTSFVSGLTIGFERRTLQWSVV